MLHYTPFLKWKFTVGGARLTRKSTLQLYSINIKHTIISFQINITEKEEKLATVNKSLNHCTKQPDKWNKRKLHTRTLIGRKRERLTVKRSKRNGGLHGGGWEMNSNSAEEETESRENKEQRKAAKLCGDAEANSREKKGVIELWIVIRALRSC